jgi:hypothetical protein
LHRNLEGSRECRLLHLQGCVSGITERHRLKHADAANHLLSEAKRARKNGTNALVPAVDNRNIAIIKADGHSLRGVQRGSGGGAVVTGEHLFSIPGDGCDHAVGDLTDAVIVGVRDIDTAIAIHGNSARPGQGSLGCAAAIAGETARKAVDVGAACQGRNRAARVYPADAVVVAVCDIDVPHTVHGHRDRRIERSRRRRSAVAAVRLLPVPGKGRDGSIFADPAYALVVRIRDVEVVAVIYGDPARQ